MTRAADYPKFEQGLRRLARQLNLPPADLKVLDQSLATLKNTRDPATVLRDPVRPITAEERAALTRADALRYADAPCACGLCQAAGVTDRPLRFVPTLTRDGAETRVWDPQTARRVVVGHWAHGAELARWYTASDLCFRRAPGLFATIMRRMVKADLPVGAKKESA